MVLLGLGLSVVAMAIDPSLVDDEIRRAMDEQPAMAAEVTVEQVRIALFVVLGGFALWALLAAGLAVLAWVGRSWAWILLCISAGLAAGLFLAVTVLGGLVAVVALAASSGTLALLIMLPVLGFISNITGLVGGALMAWVDLGVSPGMFVTRLYETTGVWHLIVGMVKAPFFAVVIAVSNHGEERLELEDYAGLGRTQPGLALLLTLFLLSLAGFPGTGGFMAKFQLLLGAVDAQLWVLSVILVLSTVVSYAYYLRLAWYAWMREPAAGVSPPPVYLPIGMRLALVIGATVVIWLGLFPGSVLDLARASAAGIGVASAMVGILP